MWRENPIELFQGKTHAARWKPNPQIALSVIQTGVVEVEGEERYHYIFANPTKEDESERTIAGIKRPSGGQPFIKKLTLVVVPCTKYVKHHAFDIANGFFFFLKKLQKNILKKLLQQAWNLCLWVEKAIFISPKMQRWMVTTMHTYLT